MNLRIGLVLLGLVPLSAMAALGDDVNSVQGDRLHMKVQTYSTQTAAAYTAHEMTDAQGVSIREFVAPGGKVFAVSWSGAAKPDLQQLLGSYFPQFVGSSAGRRGHGVLTIHDPGLVVVAGGRMRAFFGKAWVPALVPANVDVNSLP